MSNIINNIEYVRNVCMLGQGSKCCRYLVCGADGLECVKLTSLAATIDKRVANGTYNAVGDNCPGKGIKETIMGGVNVIIIEGGDTVLCDICNKDFTCSDEPGGFLFQSKAVGPCCESKVAQQIEKYHEEKYIRGVCPDGMSFKDYVIKVRNEK